MKRKHIDFFLEKYKKNHVTINDYNSIHWRGIGNARKRLSIDKNTRLMKYLNRWLNTGTNRRTVCHETTSLMK